jgi:hypothetical protein
MPPQRRPHRIRRSRNDDSNPILSPSLATQDPSIVLNLSLATTNLADVTMTEPSTPTSPTLHTRAHRRRALRREPCARFVQAVLQYDPADNDLQPWYWCASILLRLPGWLTSFSFLPQTGWSTRLARESHHRVCLSTVSHMNSWVLLACALHLRWAKHRTRKHQFLGRRQGLSSGNILLPVQQANAVTGVSARQ